MTAPTPEQQPPDGFVWWLRRFVAIEQGETRLFLSSAALFFTILCTIKLLRGMRETISTVAGLEGLPNLWAATFGFATLANVGYWWLVNRMPRRRFVLLSLHLCAVCLGLFWWLLRTIDDPTTLEWIGYAFYAWYSAFNMCVISLFWVCMVDDCREAQAKRLFGPVGAAGTIGGVVGSSAAALLVSHVGFDGLFAIAAVLVEFAVACYLWRDRNPDRPEETSGRAIAAGGVWEGIRLVVRDPRLRWFAVFIVFMTAAQSGFYFWQAEFVRDAIPLQANRAVYYSTKDAATDTLTALVQIFVTSRLLHSFGVTCGLAALPVIALAGIGMVQAVSALLLVAVTHTVWDAGRHSLVKPAREVFFTPLGLETKYKSKTFLDSMLYRGSDVAWGYLFGALKFGTLLLATIPFLLGWSAVGAAIGRRHAREAGAGSGNGQGP